MDQRARHAPAGARALQGLAPRGGHPCCWWQHGVTLLYVCLHSQGRGHSPGCVTAQPHRTVPCRPQKLWVSRGGHRPPEGGGEGGAGRTPTGAHVYSLPGNWKACSGAQSPQAPPWDPSWSPSPASSTGPPSSLMTTSVAMWAAGQTSGGTAFPIPFGWALGSPAASPLAAATGLRDPMPDWPAPASCPKVRQSLLLCPPPPRHGARLSGLGCMLNVAGLTCLVPDLPPPAVPLPVTRATASAHQGTPRRPAPLPPGLPWERL